MAWQKTGYQDAVEYDPDRHVLRYGTYEFHGGDLGLKRQTLDLDPSKLKTMNDVYLALGADQNRISQVNAANKLYGTVLNDGGARAAVFSGAEAWKNAAAQSVMNTLRPPKQQERQIWGASANNDHTAIDLPERAPTYSVNTQKLDTGMLQVTYADNVPGDYDFVNRLSSMANALSAKSVGDLGNQRPSRRTASGAF